MRRIQYILLIATIGSVCCALATAAGVGICRECGYDVGPRDKTCGHCKTSIDRAAEKEMSDVKTGQDAQQKGSGDLLDEKLVAEEMAIAKQHIREKDFEVATLFLKNAAALNQLTDPDADNARADKILELIAGCDSRRRTVAGDCPQCGGTGKASMRTTSLSGEVSHKEIRGRSCLKCRGTGQVAKQATVQERKYRRGRALTRYKTLQETRRLIPVGRAWVPEKIKSTLSAKQETVLRRMCAAPCPSCVGIGRVDCKKCRGTGYPTCSNSKCVDGMVKTKTRGSLVSSTLERKRKCSTCKGRGREQCVVCTGVGTVLCKKCSGTGERPICAKCSGQGSARCRRCSGSGAYGDAVCRSCAGEGTTMCTSCNGEGRRR